MTVPQQERVEAVSGRRFTIHYRIAGGEREAEAKAEGLRYEQTVEFPAELVPTGDIDEHVVGRIEDFSERADGAYDVTLSYADEVAGNELPQFLNVLFGNSSMTPGIRVERIEPTAAILSNFRGPRFGIDGLRELLGVDHRPLLMTALKPMGLSNENLARIAYDCALGGIDIIKDDHGLANQPVADFQERVRLCTDGVARANEETGYRSVYAPNITGPAREVDERARFAKREGAGAILYIPGLAGFDGMRALADDEDFGLPIISHPAFYGSFVTSADNGFSHYALYGQLQRLAGADSSIYPNFGGRFSFTREECASIARGCGEPFGDMRAIFPTPGGGMNMKNIPEMRSVYGQEVIYLIGGGLHRHGDDLVENSRHFRQLVFTT
ncbi:MAG: ribulose 1,5-bisphosphate carboxylase large subunit [Spirochaetes bacterium]|jgi:ribulose-bisphosphate carboxylase large chain|nr:ribulose 1,5-bisphosphate carboxylase large subunit [Spirochaetota bacterium]